MITFQCDHCGQSINVPVEHAGKKDRCPKCKNVITVPSTKDTSQNINQEQTQVVNTAGQSPLKKQNNPNNNNTSGEVGYCEVPDKLREFFEYQQFDGIMQQYNFWSILVAIILGIIISGVLLGPANLQQKIIECYWLIFIGVVISGGSISRKKVPNAISTGIWGCYSILTAVGLMQVSKARGIEEFSSRIILGATIFVIIGLILIWIAISYMRKRSVEILLAQGICFALLSIIHIVASLINIIQIASNPSLFNAMGEGLFRNIVIGLWLALSSSISLFYYRKFKGKSIKQPTRDTVDFVNRIIQEVKASRSENTPGIIEIAGGGPVWIGKLWADYLMFVIANDDEEVYFVSKSGFKLVKRWFNTTSGSVRVRFKVDGQEYNGEVSEESYHRYQKWKSNL